MSSIPLEMNVCLLFILKGLQKKQVLKEVHVYFKFSNILNILNFEN